MTNLIQYAELFPHRGWWICRYTSEPERSRVKALMGTAEIPTAYSTRVAFDEVAAALRSIPANRMIAFVEARESEAN